MLDSCCANHQGSEGLDTFKSCLSLAMTLKKLRRSGIPSRAAYQRDVAKFVGLQLGTKPFRICYMKV